MEGIEQLQQLGFSQYEAQAYVALLRRSPLNGYELAKISGVPRPNIYTVLQKLEEAGAVMRLTVPEGTRYAPIPSDELLAKLKRRYQQSVEAASASLQQIESPSRIDTVLNIRGYTELLEQARTLIDRTKRHLLLSIWPEEAMALAEPIEHAVKRGIQVTTLCLRACPQPCPACRGTVFRYALSPENRTRWLVLVSDAEELLAGEIQTSGSQASQAVDSGAVRTRQPMLVSLTGSYIQNGIALAKLITHFGTRLYSELDAQSIAALNNLPSFSAEEPWLVGLQRMLRVGESPK
jgi:HTH-type transcriptional regulator, sugar sensing transcriptional regulator